MKFLKFFRYVALGIFLGIGFFQTQEVLAADTLNFTPSSFEIPSPIAEANLADYPVTLGGCSLDADHYFAFFAPSDEILSSSIGTQCAGVWDIDNPNLANIFVTENVQYGNYTALVFTNYDTRPPACAETGTVASCEADPDFIANLGTVITLSNPAEAVLGASFIPIPGVATVIASTTPQSASTFTAFEIIIMTVLGVIIAVLTVNFIIKEIFRRLALNLYT